MTAVSAIATDLVAYVNTLLELSANPLDFATEIKKNDMAAIVAAIVPKAGQLLAHDAETDVEGAFSMLFDLVRVLPKDDGAEQATKLLAAVLAKADEKAVLRLRIAAALFNKSAALPELRFDALVQVIAYAKKTENVDLVASYFDDIESLFAASPLSTEQRRKLFLTIAEAVQTVDTHRNLQVLLVLEKYLSTFAAGAPDLASAKDAAVRAAKLMLQQPVTSFVARVDLISNPVVAATLKGDKLYELLDIVSNKTLAEYMAFRKSAGAAFFQDNALDADALESTQRLFTLCSLPASSDEISYAVIAKALAIDEDAVEQWVVKAITASLVSAKVDQLKRTVVISRTLQRGFGAEQWQDVHAKLQLYKKNVASLLDVVRSARQAHQQK